MSGFLWGLQIFFAVYFIVHVGFHIFPPDTLRRLMEQQAIPRMRQTANVAEVVGVVGLVLPGAFGIEPWLTWLASAGLALIMILATAFHLRRHERSAAVMVALIAGILVFLAVERASAYRL